MFGHVLLVCAWVLIVKKRPLYNKNNRTRDYDTVNHILTRHKQMKQNHFHHNFHKQFHSYIYKWQNNLSIISCNSATNRCNCNNVMLLFKDGWYIAIASLSINSSKKIISHNNEIIRGRWMVAKKQMIVYWALIALRYLTFFVVSVDKPTCPSVLTLIKFKYFIILKCVK